LQAEGKRPIVITIIATLIIINSVLALINSFYFTTVGPVLSAISPTYREVFEMSGWTWFITVSGVFGIMMLGFAIAFSVAALSVLKDKWRARAIILIVSIASIILNIVMTMIVIFGIIEFIEDTIAIIVSAIINGVIIWLLFRSNVKKYFDINR
jgi:hypothetical protein